MSWHQAISPAPTTARTTARLGSPALPGMSSPSPSPSRVVDGVVDGSWTGRGRSSSSSAGRRLPVVVVCGRC